MFDWLKRSAAVVALKKMKPINRVLMIAFLILAAVYAALTYLPGWVASFL